MRPRAKTAWALVLGGGVTFLVGVLPFVYFRYESPVAHVALESAEGVIATICAFLVFGRFRISHRRSDLLLMCALSLFATSNLFSVAVVAVGLPRAWPAWALLVVRLVGASVLAASAFVTGTVQRSESALSWTGVATGAFLAATGVTIAMLSGELPHDFGASRFEGPATKPLLVGHPAILTFQLVAVVPFAAAALGYTRRAERQHDEFAAWLGAGSALAAWARVNYFLFPSLYTRFVYTGDLLRMGFYLLLLVAAAREVRSYWRRIADAAVNDERRRVARDLHDGLAQELAFISTRARHLANVGSTRKEDSVDIARSAERALLEARGAIEALTTTDMLPLEESVAREAEEVARRLGAQVRLELASGLKVSPDVRVALVRIIREAVANAARHGRASSITVRLIGNGGVRLVIDDDGLGFDPDRVRRGFGLTSMQERAEGAGGSLTLKARPGEGTVVEVSLPWARRSRS